MLRLQSLIPRMLTLYCSSLLVSALAWAQSPELSFQTNDAVYRQSDFHVLSFLTFEANRPFQAAEVAMVLRQIGATGSEHRVPIAWPYSAPQRGALAIYQTVPEMLDEGETDIRYRIVLANGKAIPLLRRVTIDSIPPTIERKDGRLLIEDQGLGLRSVVVTSTGTAAQTPIQLPGLANSYVLDLSKFNEFASLTVLDAAGNATFYPQDGLPPQQGQGNLKSAQDSQPSSTTHCKSIDLPIGIFTSKHDEYPALTLAKKAETLLSSTQEVAKRMKEEWLAGVQAGSFVAPSNSSDSIGELNSALGQEWLSAAEVTLADGAKLVMSALDLEPLSETQAKKLAMFFGKVATYKKAHPDRAPIVVVDFINKKNGKKTLSTWLSSEGVMLVPWLNLVLSSQGAFTLPDPHTLALALAHELGHAVGNGHVQPAVAHLGDFMAEGKEQVGTTPTFRDRQKLLFSARMCSSGLMDEQFGKFMPAVKFEQYRCNNSMIEYYLQSNKEFAEEAERTYIGSFEPGDAVTVQMVKSQVSGVDFRACVSEVDGKFVVSHPQTFSCQKLKDSGSQNLLISTDGEHTCAGVELKPCQCQQVSHSSGGSGSPTDVHSDPEECHDTGGVITGPLGGPTCGGTCPVAADSCVSVPGKCECVPPSCGNSMVELWEGCDPPAAASAQCAHQCPSGTIIGACLNNCQCQHIDCPDKPAPEKPGGTSY